MKNFIAKMGAVLLSSAAALVFTACDLGGGLKDTRDGKTYKTVKIGDKVWMAENLNFDYNHGTAKSVCYENKPENCEKYGRLYTWAAAMDSAAIFSKDGARCGYGKKCDAIGTVRGVCPEGWHLPSKEDLEELKKLAGQKAGDIDKAGTVLKSSAGWKEDDGKSGNGSDGFGFGALFAGDYNSIFGHFNFEGSSADFWSSTELNERYAYDLALYYSSEYAFVYVDIKDFGYSVRCVKNN